MAVWARAARQRAATSDDAGCVARRQQRVQTGGSRSLSTGLRGSRCQMAVARDTVPFRTEWQVEPAHGVVISDDDRLCATQTGGGAYVWSAVPLPTAGCVYWELEFELPKPGIPAPTWITREDLQRYVEDNAGRLKTAKAPLAACCSSKPQKPPAESTRQLLRRLGSGWTMKALLKRLDELAKTNPADIEWPGPPEPTTLRRGDSLGGAYFAGVVEGAFRLR